MNDVQIPSPLAQEAPEPPRDAKEGDHRSLGRRLDLFSFREEAPGMVLWHPRGYAMYHALEEAVRVHVRAQGYQEVKTPQIMRRSVWEASGHWEHFYDGMFRLSDGALEAAVKPVSCPGHLLVALRRPPSYKELPLRYFELGQVHRDEASGTLHGLLRARQFTQDDGHVICAIEDAGAEVERFCRGVAPFYRAFGFDRGLEVAFSSRPKDRAGDDARWDRAEALLLEVLARLGIAYTEQPGQGAFYGPKLELSLLDRQGRRWQCGTIQVDLVMPERFGLVYVDEEGKRRTPVMLHRALYGSLERFLGIFLEEHGEKLPAWIAPLQAVVLPVTDAQAPYAARVLSALAAAGLRAEGRDEGTLAKRIAKVHDDGVPLVVIVGKREAAGERVTLRFGMSEGQLEASLEEGVARAKEHTRPPAFV